MGEKHPRAAGEMRYPHRPGCPGLQETRVGRAEAPGSRPPSLGLAGCLAFPGSGWAGTGEPAPRSPPPGPLPRVRRHAPHSLFFLTTGMGTTWKILAWLSSVARVTQVGR